jgi:hypothetical protein
MLFLAAATLCLVVYQPALNGGLVSDDATVLLDNPLVGALTWQNVAAMFDFRVMERDFSANYAPVHDLLVAIERWAFGANVFALHVVNVLFHALNSVLLVAWLRSSRLPLAAALLGGLLFALHPANVEAVAWMSQSKTDAALSFSLLALLAFRPAPAAATLLFTAGLLTKASALFALPTAAALTWARAGAAGGGRRPWVWLAVWGLISGLYAVPEFAMFAGTGQIEAEAYPDLATQLRSIASYGSHYLVMAVSSYGLSAFHQPEPAGLFDPWWLAALPLSALLLWRIVLVARRRSEELAYWVAAAAAFAPISQIFPFIYPMGDRYLYFILPGLIGGTLFLALEGRERLASLRGADAAAAATRVALAAGVALAIFFGLRSHGRAGVWRDDTRLFIDAERHYPDGGPANLLKARRAAQMGDVAGAVSALERAEERGFDNFMALPEDPALAPIAGTADFVEFQRAMAGRWIVQAEAGGRRNQASYHLLAHAHMLREEWAEAEVALAQAIAAPGPQRSILEAELAQLRMSRPR